MPPDVLRGKPLPGSAAIGNEFYKGIEQIPLGDGHPSSPRGISHRQAKFAPFPIFASAAAFLVTVFLADLLLSLLFPNTGFGITS